MIELKYNENCLLYLNSVREIEQRIFKMESGAKQLLDLPEAPIGPPDDFEELLKIQYEMMAFFLSESYPNF